MSKRRPHRALQIVHGTRWPRRPRWLRRALAVVTGTFWLPSYPPGATVAGIQEHRHQPTGFTILGPDDEPWQFDNEADRAGFALFQAFLADPHAKQ